MAVTESDGVAATDGDEPTEPGREGVRGPGWLPAALIVTATLLAILAVFSTWAKVQALDTEAWVETSDELLDDPAVQEALAVYLVDELYERLDVAGEFEEQLPEDAKGLAGPVSAALRGPATTGVERLIASEQTRQAWSRVNRVAHESMVNILRDETRTGVSTADGTVTLELGELVQEVGERLGLSESLLERLPEDAGRVTVFESDELASAQQVVRVLELLSWFLLILVVVLYAAAVYLAAGRRLEVLRHVGLSLVGAGLFVLIARAIGVRLIVDRVVADPGSRPLAELTGFVGTGLMRQMAWSGIAYGVVITGFVALMGETRPAVAIRRFLAPLFNASNAATAGLTALALLLLVWWSPGRAFDRWVTALVLLALTAGAVVTLGRAVRREFPTVGFDDVGRSVASGVGAFRLRARSGSAQSGSAESGSARPDTLAGELEALDSLHRSGALTDDDFAMAKRKVLADVTTRS